MIRERRTREKLQAYYRKYIDRGALDPNVHPWVAEAWQKSRVSGVSAKQMGTFRRLTQEDLARRLAAAQSVVDSLDGLYAGIRDFLSQHNISLLLLDREAYVLKSYAMSYYQKTPGELEGVRLAERDIGASSIGIAMTHRTPFFLYGPEIWAEECHDSDAATAPVMCGGEIRYLVSLVAQDGLEKHQLSTDALSALLLSLKISLEQTLELGEKLAVRHQILDRLPMVVYQVDEAGKVLYANKMGLERLRRVPGGSRGSKPYNLNEMVLNYSHTRIPKAFLGVPSQNRELVWIIGGRSYEDIADVWPLYGDSSVHSVNIVSAPIEELKTLVAHASQYKARYSLQSMVGDSPKFSAMKDKAARCAKHSSNLLIVGEAGTGKQRLAHGIHQASNRAAGPLITVRCGDIPAELLPQELFGQTDTAGAEVPGKIELARGGTLFIDEIDKVSLALGDQLLAVLKREDTVRVIAAADIDPKRLAAKRLFSEALYNAITNAVIRTPPLRHHQSDIPLIAADILKELAEQHPIDPKTLTPDALDLLMSYDWPGNVKQLQGVVEQGFFRANGSAIQSTDLILPGGAGWGKAWKKDRNLFMEAWKACGGNISRLAANLGVSRVTLYRYLEKYGLERKRK